jgi:cysteinyl-tRNA synthetase
MSGIVVHNTLTRRKEPLQPLVPGQIGMYLCGPTVYDDCHIGHVAGPVLFDAVARWLRERGLTVRFVNNITDIDDKIINRAKNTGEAWDSITARYTEQYFGYLRQLGVDTITDHPRCTEYIPQMVAYVADLVANDRAYLAADGVYYDVAKQDGYGKLSGRRLDDMLSGERIQRDSSLRNPADFCLWKLAKPGEPSWPSPWGDGRPGWHIECSVMSTEILGTNFDIHAGGDDLKFPHHENEIAQAEAHSGCYANCWMHNGLLQFDGVKIGKSDPRMKDEAFRDQFRLERLLTTHGAPTVRFLLLQGHYRRPNDFAPSNLEAQRTALERLYRLLGDEAEAPTSSSYADCLANTADDSALHDLVERFGNVLDDDFRTGDAIAVLFTLADRVRKHDDARARTLLRDLGRVLGLFRPGEAAMIARDGATSGDLSTVMNALLVLRQDTRARRDFAAADALRDALNDLGITVKDSKDGAIWSATAGDDAQRATAIRALIEPLLTAAQSRGDQPLMERVQAALAGG